MSNVKIPRSTFVDLLNLLSRLTIERGIYGSQLTDEDYELASSIYEVLEDKLDKMVLRETYHKRNQI